MDFTVPHFAIHIVWRANVICTNRKSGIARKTTVAYPELRLIDAVKNNGIRLFLCEDGNCFEKEVIYSISWNAFCALTQCEEIGFPCQHIRIAEDLKNRISLATSTQEQDKIREEILQKAIKDSKEWFKHIPGGEFLGSIVLDDIENIPNDNNLKKNIVELINWCGFGKD